MTDRELLERAAKAAGVFLTRETMAARWPEFEWCYTDEPEFDGKHLNGTVFCYDGRGGIGGTETLSWNPLEDDGDALRLAVKLGLHIQPSDIYCWATHLAVTAIEPLDSDPYAATRRAIVRAAAEMAPKEPA